MGDADRPAWLPLSLREAGHTVESVGRLSYIVVDEIVDDVVTLALHAWPVADAAGRVRFPDLAACRHVAVSLHVLQTQLYRGWLTRAPRLGDVFGAVLTEGARRRLAVRDDVRWRRGLHSLLETPIYDLSADARVVAKLAYYAAMAPVLAQKEVDRWGLAEKAEPPVAKAKARSDLAAAPVGEADG
jgi:hypothetical protein